MNNKVASVLIFAAGATVGSVVTWQLLKTAYDKFTTDAIAEIKEYYEGKYAEKEPKRFRPATPEEIETRKREEEQYEQLAMSYSDISEDESDEPEFYDGPFVISPCEYGEGEDFDTHGLTYYSDGVLVDDDTEEIVEDADDIVGSDFAEHFGDYENDAVHIRNPRMRIDYEILLDEKAYSEVYPDNPHRKEVG